MRAPRLSYLAGAADDEIVFKNVFGDRRAGANIAVAFNGNGGDDVAVTADKAVVAYDGFMFFLAVVIDEDCAATDVAAFPKLAVAHVRKVGNFGVFADDGVFNFYEIADFRVVENFRIRAQPREWTYANVVPDFRVFGVAKFDGYAVADLAVFDTVIGQYHAAVAYDGIPFDTVVFVDGYVVAKDYAIVDKYAVFVDNFKIFSVFIHKNSFQATTDSLCKKIKNRCLAQNFF